MLTNDERETHLNMMANDRSTWECYSDDPIMMRKLDKIAKFIRNYGEGKVYELEKGQVSLRRKKKPMTEEQKAEARQRLADARKSISSQSLEAQKG